MFGVEPQIHWQGEMSEYVSAIAGSNNGRWIAVADAGGRVCRIELATLQILEFQANSGESIDCLAFSANDQFLAAAGQAGKVMIWRMQPETELITVLEYPGAWIDRLVWHPMELKLTFQVGFDLYVADLNGPLVPNAGGTGVESLIKAPSIGGLGASQIMQLPIGATAQSIQWRPQGDLLAVAANDRLLTWKDGDWDDQSVIPLAAPATSIGWSKDGRYLALGNLERNLFVWAWGNADPWRMQGFPGKVGRLDWSRGEQLAVSSLEGVVLWERSGDNWENQLLVQHQKKVTAIAFQPGTNLLASGGMDGVVMLWVNGQVVGRLDCMNDGVSSLVWQARGDYLMVGGVNGELKIWKIENDASVDRLNRSLNTNLVLDVG